MSNELVIDDSNFKKYFRDVSTHPEKGDILARYTAIAELVYGDLKQDIIKLLKNSDFGAKTSVQIMKKLGKTNEIEALRVVKLMCKDLLGGMTDEEVLAKSYKYTFEMSFFTKKEYVPLDDLHWEIMKINNLDEYLDIKENFVRDENGNLVKKIIISEKEN